MAVNYDLKQKHTKENGLYTSNPRPLRPALIKLERCKQSFTPKCENDSFCHSAIGWSIWRNIYSGVLDIPSLWGDQWYREWQWYYRVLRVYSCRDITAI